MSVRKALGQFVSQYQVAYPRLTEVFDPEWRSPCEVDEPFADSRGVQRVAWEPLARHGAEDFVGLEHALELTIHQDIKDYYGSFWSGGLEADAKRGPVSLILLWNGADAERLVENLIGHALAKRRLRAPFTVFFACTSVDSELFLSVDNDSGEVLLEKPGYKPIEVVAPSLTEFLGELAPAPPERNPERAMLA